jgi:hypothetical protein
VRYGASEQRAANAAATVCWEDRESNFGDIVFAGKMCQTNELMGQSMEKIQKRVVHRGDYADTLAADGV